MRKRDRRLSSFLTTIVFGYRQRSQNVRLAVKLTGWRIDIKSASSVEEEKAEAAAAEKEAADLLRIWQWKMRMEIWNRLPRN